MYIVLIKCIVTQYIFFFTHKAQKDLDKKLKQGCFQNVGNLIFTQYSTPIETSELKIDTLFCADSFFFFFLGGGGILYTNPQGKKKKTPNTPNTFLGTSLVILFLKSFKGCIWVRNNSFCWMGKGGLQGMHTNRSRTTSQWKIANQHSSLPPLINLYLQKNVDKLFPTFNINNFITYTLEWQPG